FFDSNTMDAVLCVNEIFAIYGMRVVQKKGLKIPEDVSFIGFTDGPLSKYANPSLSAVAQHGESMGAIAAQMLIDKVENEEEEEVYRTEILDSTLIERESTIN
ncbi:MAG: substrate-binding domain-containing protein, partial [Flavobacteriales bacterium]